MAYDKLYLPLALIRNFKDSCPGIFEMYDEKIRTKKDDEFIFDIGNSIGEYYFPKNRCSDYQYTRYNLSSRVGKYKEHESEVEQCAIRCLILGEWRKSKQVYSFSREFYDMISDIDDFEVDSQIFSYMPYPSIYIEFENDLNIHGMFAKYIKDEVNDTMFFILIENDQLHHVIISFDFKDTMGIRGMIEKMSSGMERGEESAKALIFGFQACMYLCSKNCDVVENPVQMKIYRNSRTVKDKYSEVRKWDVGYRVVRDTQYYQSSSRNLKGESIVRNRPRQHWRKAHWHTYWVGEGRKERVLKFIAPILVNDNNDEEPIVEHNL